jgi:hypothetical protein
VVETLLKHSIESVALFGFMIMANVVNASLQPPFFTTKPAEHAPATRPKANLNSATTTFSEFENLNMYVPQKKVPKVHFATVFILN